MLCEQNPAPASEAKGTLKRMTDADRAELGLPPLLQPRANRNFADFSEGAFTKEHVDAGRDTADAIRAAMLTVKMVKAAYRIK